MGYHAPAMRGEAPAVYVNTERAAALLGVSAATVRRRCEGGDFPGATRIGARGSAWRIPLAALTALTLAASPAAPTPAPTTTPRRAVVVGSQRGVSADPFRDGPNVTSGHRSPAALVHTAHRVSERLSTVTTRPALALSDVMSTLAAAAVRHTADADGRCMACRWPSFPCPDAELLTLAIDRAASLVLDGE